MSMDRLNEMEVENAAMSDKLLPAPPACRFSFLALHLWKLAL